MRRLLVLLLGMSSLSLLPLASAGCVHVRPWQRGDLAKETMTFDSAPGERTLRVHLTNAREGATGGEGSGGGGCGCD